MLNLVIWLRKSCKATLQNISINLKINYFYIAQKIINNKFIGIFKDQGLYAPRFFVDKNDVNGGLAVQIFKKLSKTTNFAQYVQFRCKFMSHL